MMIEPYPHTVLVSKAFNDIYQWSCGCGKSRVFNDERKCREEGLEHQLAHRDAYRIRYINVLKEKIEKLTVKREELVNDFVATGDEIIRLQDELDELLIKGKA